jgi:predicted amino acid dehydrogenase
MKTSNLIHSISDNGIKGSACAIPYDGGRHDGAAGDDGAALRLRRRISAEEIREQLPKGQGGIGFLFHATDWDSLLFSFDNVQKRSPSFEQILWDTKPFIASAIYAGTQVIGANIACPVPLELWLGSASGIKRFRESQLFPGLALAKQAGLNMVAMGASTPYACNYGLLAREHTQPYITTGHAATAAILKEWTIHCCEQVGVPFGAAKIAVFGAAGRMGLTLARYLCYKNAPMELVLIDLPDKINLLKTQAAELLAAIPSGRLKISIHTFNSGVALPKFDGAIMVSCTSTPYLSAADLRQARFWIDDSHPRAASVEAELASRADTLYIECFVRGPAGLNIDYAFHLPTQQDCYTCFAEGYAAWQEGINADFVTGSPPVWTVAYTHSLLKKSGFGLGPFIGKNGALLDAALDHSIAVAQ